MERVLLDEVIETDYGQFDLHWGGVGFGGEVDQFFAHQLNGLVGAGSPEGVFLHFGRRSGGSKIRILLRDGEPDGNDESWEDVVEVSTTVPDGATVGWSSWAGESGGQLSAVGPGTYRIRVSAKGRDAGRADEFAEEVVDEYLVELWPATVAPDEILRVGSDDARYWHAEWGNRR